MFSVRRRGSGPRGTPFRLCRPRICDFVWMAYGGWREWALGSGAACLRCARGRMCRCVLQPRLSVGPQTGLAGFAASTAFASMAAGVSRGGWALARRTGSIAGEFYSLELVKLYSNCVCVLFAAGFRVRGGCRSGFVILEVTILCEWRTVAGASRMAAGSGVAGSRCARGRIGHWRRALLVTPRTSLAAFCQTNTELLCGRPPGLAADKVCPRHKTRSIAAQLYPGGYYMLVRHSLLLALKPRFALAKVGCRLLSPGYHLPTLNGWRARKHALLSVLADNARLFRNHNEGWIFLGENPRQIHWISYENQGFCPSRKLASITQQYISGSNDKRNFWGKGNVNVPVKDKLVLVLESLQKKNWFCRGLNEG